MLSSMHSIKKLFSSSHAAVNISGFMRKDEDQQTLQQGPIANIRCHQILVNKVFCDTAVLNLGDNKNIKCYTHTHTHACTRQHLTPRN